MFGGTFDQVLRVIEEWHPRKAYRSEAGYRNDLIAFIRKEITRGGIWGAPERHLIQKESGRHLADIGIDNEIGIELKRNLKSKKELNRLVGQIEEYKDSYRYIIVVLCGETDIEKLDALRYRYKGYSGRGFVLGQPETIIEIVKKGKQKEKKGPKGWVDLFEEI